MKLNSFSKSQLQFKFQSFYAQQTSSCISSFVAILRQCFLHGASISTSSFSFAEGCFSAKRWHYSNTDVSQGHVPVRAGLPQGSICSLTAASSGPPSSGSSWAPWDPAVHGTKHAAALESQHKLAVACGVPVVLFQDAAAFSLAGNMARVSAEPGQDCRSPQTPPA